MPSKIRVLLVDDSEILRMSYKYGLEGNGFEVETAEGVIKGLEKLASFNPQIAVCDFKMLDGTGIDFAKCLQEKRKNREIVLIGYGSYNCNESAVRDLFDRCLNKQSDYTDLLPVLEEYRQMFQKRES